MKKIILPLLFLISLVGISQPVSRATLTTSPYGWGMRQVPPLANLKNTWLSFHNIIDDGAAATATNSMVFTNKTGNISMWTNNSNFITLGSLSATSPLSYDATTGTFSIQPGWSLIGNAPSTNTNFIGTTNNTRLQLKANNFIVMKGDSLGGNAYFPHAVSIGNSTVIASRDLDIHNKTGSTTAQVWSEDAAGAGIFYCQGSDPSTYLGIGNSGASFTVANSFLRSSATWVDMASPWSFLMNSSSVGTLAIAVGGDANTKERCRHTTVGTSFSGKASTKITSPTAIIHIAATGSTTSGNAPLKLTTTGSSLMATPEAGSFETDDNGALYFTPVSTRKTFAYLEGGAYTGAITSTSSIQTPTLYGSTASGGTLNLSSTSHTTQGLIQIASTGTVNIGNAAVNSTSLGIVRIGQGTSWIDIGQSQGAFPTIWMQQATPSTSNYMVAADVNQTYLNGPTAISVGYGNAARITVSSTGIKNTLPTKIGDATAAVASAVLELTSTTKGFLPSRMTATQGSAISSPAEGLIIYVTDTNGTFTAKGWWGYDGAAWQKLNN